MVDAVTGEEHEPSVTLRVQLIARFSVLLPDGRRAGPWVRPTARRLVQLLSLREEHRIGREEAAELLFPDLSPAGAANGVAKALSMARTAIGPVGPGGVPALVADRASIWIHDAVRLRSDLVETRGALHAALALPAGDERDAALTDALSTDAMLLPDEPYSEWAIAPREELEERRRTARLELARDRSNGHGQSDLTSVTAAWSALALQDATSEEAAIGLMRAHAAAGQRDRAIRAYVRCVSALRSELEVEPSEHLEAAYVALASRRLDSPAAVQGDWHRDRRLFGREKTLARLRRSLARTAAGRGQAFLLLGPTGIGKSHLLASLTDELSRAGWGVLVGRSVPDDRRAPFAALRQALAPLIAVDGSASPLLQQVLGLAAEPDSLPDAEPGEAERVTLTADLATILDRAADRRPVALVLDDIQWADAAFHGLLRRLLARPEPRRWSLVLAARSDEPDAPPPDLGSSIERVSLPPLEERATAAAVRAALADDGERRQRSAVAAAVERSGGNPFFAIELARASPGDQEPAAHPPSIPDSIVALLRRRLQTVSAPSRAMLSIVALAGSDATYDLVLNALARLREGGDRPTHIDLDELVAAQLVIEQGDHLALLHPLLRDAAVSTINAVRRSAAHVAIAETLESDADPPDAARSEAAARHRLAAFEATRIQAYARPAVEAGFRAGRRARHVHAPEVALSLFAGALDAYKALPTTGQHALRREACAVLLTIGNIHLDHDDDAAAEAAYIQARDLADSDADEARTWSALAGIPYRHGDMGAALAKYRSGVDALDGTDPTARARLESDAAWVLMRLGRAAEALEVMERVAPTLIAAPETHLRCRSKDRLGLALNAVGRHDEGLTWLNDGVADATEHDDDRELMVLSLHRGELLTDLGRGDEAKADFSRAARIAEVAHDRYMRAVVHWRTAVLHHARGDRAAALAERDAEVEILSSVRNDRHLAGAHAHRAELLQQLGRGSDALEAATAARHAADRAADGDFAHAISRQLAAAMTAGKDSGTAAS